MRKVLLTLLCVSLVCTSVFAFWAFNRPITPTFNEAELRAALAELAPTEAEAKAIAALRKSFQEPPVEVEPVDDENVQIHIYCQFISGTAELIRKATGHPAMEWSPLPVAAPFANQLAKAAAPANMAVSAVNTQIPIQIRYLEPENAQKFSGFFQSQRAASVMEAPSLVLNNGQVGSIQDTTTIPFVTNVVPIVADNAVGYQPIITKIDQGMTTQIQATLLQDGSYRLTSQWTISYLVKVEQFRFIDEEPTPQQLADSPSAKGGITIQQPIVRTLSVTMPDVVIPEGMSLLVAFPGVEVPHWHNNRNDNVTYGAFMLITPTKVDCNPELKQDHDEWERFWMLDTPPNQGKLTREMQSLETPAEQETVEPKSFTFGIRYVR